MNPQKQKNWKLLIDPFLIKGSTKLVRFEGQVLGDPTYPPVHVRDPRSHIPKLWSRLEVLDLPVPRFKIDSDYVGEPPAIEVTIFNVNDNIDKVFLGDLVKKYGPWEELQIYYHPKTNKHLGMARVVFESVKSAKACVEKLNQTSVMGKPLQVFLDPFGAECKKRFDSVTTEKKPEPKPEVKKHEQKIKEEPKEIPVPIPSAPAIPPQSLKKELSSNNLSSSVDAEETFFNTNGHNMDGTFNFPPPNFSVPPPSTDYFGGWHPPPFWNSSTNSWLSQPPPDSNNYLDDQKDEEKEEPVSLDLDTRIELLLKGKITAALNTPAFLQLQLDGSSNSGSSRSSSRAADHETKAIDSAVSPPLSPPPSPFLSQEIYLEHHKATHPDTMGINSGGEILNDEMSLSSLSSGDEKILNADGTKIEIDQVPSHVPTFGSTFFPPPNYPVTDPYFAWRNMYGTSYPPQNSFPQGNANQSFPNFNYPPPNGYAPFVDVTHATSNILGTDLTQTEQDVIDPYASTIEGVVERIVTELKQILKKDFTRRMVEGTAFKAFESWWDEQTKREVHETAASTSAVNTSEVTVQPSISQIKSLPGELQLTAPAVTTTEKKVALGLEGMNFGFGLGLGLRAAMPKLPSFKRKIRPPSPPPLDDDDSRRRLRDSDDEARDGRKRRRYSSRSRGSMRSLYSSSSSSSSSSEDEGTIAEKHRRNRRLRSISFSSQSSSEESSNSDSESISGAESISEDSLPSSPRLRHSPVSKQANSELDLELEEVSPERPPTPDLREEPEDQLPHIIEQAKEKEDSDSSAASVYQDHCYSLPPREEPANSKERSVSPALPVVKRESLPPVQKTAKPRAKTKHAEIKKSQNSFTHIKISTTPEWDIPKKTFSPRDMIQEMSIFYDFLAKGIDLEDINFFHKSYEILLSQETAQTEAYWLNETHWVDYDPPELDPLPSKRKRREEPRPHKTGCARTEGFYKLDSKEKAKHKSHYARTVADDTKLAETNSFSAKATGIGAVDTTNKMQTLSREARSNQRRLLTAFGLENDSDLLKFNQLKFRGAKLKFGKSSIHDWGLFALEPIAADEMVIEYVGQIVRPVLADLRETQYEAVGIGSSYLFRVDLECIIDATKCGNLARFINHSCNPNCYARVITIEGQKKIVIYSKQPIAVGEEITYDYKFPIEEDKIVCLCGSSQCRGYLN